VRGIRGEVYHAVILWATFTQLLHVCVCVCEGKTKKSEWKSFFTLAC